MVENRTEEMDDQNKQMLKQIPNLPKSGKIDAKARVVDEGGNLIFDVYHIKTSVKEESIDFSGKQQKEEKKEKLSTNAGNDKETLSTIGEHQNEVETNELSSEIQENKENSDLVGEQRKEEPNNELISGAQMDKDSINLNVEQKKEITNEAIVPDIQEKDKAVSSVSNGKASE